VPLTGNKECDIIQPRLSIGFDQILKYPYRKGETTHTKKIVRVCDGTVTVLDPATKTQIVVGLAILVGDILVLALPVHRES